MDEDELCHRLRELADDSPDTTEIRAALSAGTRGERRRPRRLPLLVAAAVVLVTGGTIAVLGDRMPAPQQPGFQPRPSSSGVTTDGQPSRSSTTGAADTSSPRSRSTSATSPPTPSPTPTSSPTPTRSTSPRPSPPGTTDQPATTPAPTELEQPPSVGTTSAAPTAPSSAPPGATR